VAIARLLEPTGSADTGAGVRQRVEAALDDLAAGDVPSWLAAPLAHLVTVLRRLGPGLYHCYDVPDLPRTNNALEQFYRRVKAGERRTTGHRRSDRFVVRVGGFAVYALASSTIAEPALTQRLASIPSAAWRAQRRILHANQERQVKMRRFHLHRAAYLADLEARWTQLSHVP